MLLSKYYLKALDTIVYYHNGELRKDNKTPYATHPLIVMQIVYEMGVRDQSVLCAALLHDLLEDSNITEKEISDKFGLKTLTLVKELTVDKDESLPVNVRYQNKINSIKKLSKDAAVIKFADLLHNTKHLSMQVKQTPEIENRFSGGFLKKSKLERQRLEEFKKHHKHIKHIDELEKAVLDLEKAVLS